MKKHSYSNRGTSLHTCKRYSKIFNKWFMLLLLVVFAAGCKKVTEEAGLTGICPAVIFTSPADVEQSVSLNKNAFITELLLLI